MTMLIGHETGHWGEEVIRERKFAASPLVADFGDEVGDFFEYRICV